MHQDLIQGRAARGLQVQDLCDQVLGLLGEDHVLGELVGVHADLLVGGLDIAGLEGGLADEQCVDDDAQGPDVDFVAVAGSALQNFGGWGCVILNNHKNICLFIFFSTIFIYLYIL